jgi:type I restriction enzyme, S subunit
MGSNWTKGKLGEIAIIEMGQSPLGETCNQEGIGMPLLNGPTEFGGYHPTPVQFTTDARKLSIPDDILFCVRGSTTGRMNWADQKYAIGRGIAAMRHRSGSEYRYFLKALIDLHLDRLLASATGSTFPNVSREQLTNLHCEIPSLPEQRAIAGILGALDDKIELNRQMNRTLELMARAVFRQWFVENEDVGNWEVGKLGHVITNFDSRRVPVANRERAQRQGIYPYYGAASVMDYVDDYLFDGIYVLMGEDGSVVDDEGRPVIQYVWGKIWVNNHAHVLQGTNGICNEHLYLFLKDANILPYITGAVQPKINQANMNSIPFPLPPMELRKKFEEFVSPLFARIRANDEESRTLASLRDSLLPKLMRGEVRVKDD